MRVQAPPPSSVLLSSRASSRSALRARLLSLTHAHYRVLAEGNPSDLARTLCEEGERVVLFLVYFRTVTLEVAVVTKMPGSIVLLTFW